MAGSSGTAADSVWAAAPRAAIRLVNSSARGTWVGTDGSWLWQRRDSGIVYDLGYNMFRHDTAHPAPSATPGRRPGLPAAPRPDRPRAARPRRPSYRVACGGRARGEPDSRPGGDAAAGARRAPRARQRRPRGPNPPGG